MAVAASLAFFENPTIPQVPQELLGYPCIRIRLPNGALFRGRFEKGSAYKALKRHGSPEAITTDGLRSYGAVMNELGNREKQETGRWANNRIENSHLLFRRRERAMLRFRQMKTLQKFASVHANIHNNFSLERHLIDRETSKGRRSAALAEWQVLAR
jgi:hypothetical protein